MQVSLSSSAGNVSSSSGSDIAKLQKQLWSLTEELKGVATSNLDAKAKKEKVKLLQAQIQMVQAQISAIQRARQQEQQEAQSRKAEATNAQRRTSPRRPSSLGSQLDTFA
jgi:predicted ribosome quality control (RQC) complex YloA/Tae2 family protein